MKNTRMLLVLAFAVIFGVAAGYSALRYLRERPTSSVPAGDRETVPVVLAAKDLPLGTVLAEEDLLLMDWPAEAVPGGFATSKDELVGRSLISNVQTNEAILAGKLADSGLLGIIPLIPPGMRALSVRVDEIVGVAGFVTPQTRVDVILIQTPPGSSEQVSKTILQNIQTLASGSTIQETEDGTPITVSVVTVLVTPADAEKLALAAQEGELRMALRNTTDLETVETTGERASGLLAVGGPAPRRVTVRTETMAPAPEGGFIEVYRAGVRSLIRY